MRRVGVFGRWKDAHVRALSAALEAAGAEPVVVDFQGFPRFNLATMGSACTFQSVLTPEEIELDALDLVCLRSFCFSQFDDEGTASSLDVARFHREQIARVAFQHSLALRLARKVPVVNPPHAFRFHRQKARQHELLRRHEISLPRTLVISDASRARAFIDALDQRVVAKPLSGGAEVVMADFAFLSAQADRLRARPFIFQQYVKGRAFRAYVLGGRTVSFGEIRFMERRRLPDPRGGVKRGRHGPASVGAERGPTNLVRMPSQRRQLLSTVRVPYFRGPVPGTGEDTLSVWTEGRRADCT